MASLFQIRRGSGSVDLNAGELYNNQTLRTLQMGVLDSSSVTLAKLNEQNSGSFDITGNLIVSGNTTIVGNLQFGSTSSVDTVTLLSEVSSSIIPYTNNTFKLGSVDKKWNEIYGNVISGSSITGSLSGSVNGIDVTLVANRLDNLEIISQSYNEFTESINSFTQSTNDFTASITESFNSTSGSLNNVSQSLLNISTSYTAVSESFDIISSSFSTFSASQYNADSTSFDLRIDELETYSSSLKTAIDVTGGDTIIKGNLIVQGTQTSLDSSILNVADKNITIASGSVSSATSDGAGIYIAGADVSMSWNDGNQRIELNKDFSVTGSISSSTLVGLGNVTLYSESVDSRLDVIEAFSSSIKTEVSNSVSGNINKVAYFNKVHSVVDYVHSFIGQKTFGLGTAATSSEAERLMVDNGQSYNIATFQTSRQDSYAEVNIRNFGSGSSSSTDLVLWNDVSTESSSFVDLGINSSNYSAPEVGYGGDGYLLNAANDLYVGCLLSGSHGHLHLFAGNLWESSSINVYGDGTVGINTDKYDNNATTIPHSSQGFAVEVSGSVIFSNNINVSGSVSASTINGIGNVTEYSTSVDSRLDVLENFSSSQYNADSSSFDSRVDALELIGAVVVSGSPVLEYETNGTLGNILIKGSTSKAIQVVDTITFTGLSTSGNQYSATGLQLTGSLHVTQDITASGDLFVSGTIYATELYTQFVTSSVIFTSGSNQIGDNQNDVLTITGSLYQTGSTSFSELSGSLFEFSASLNSRISSSGIDVNALSASIYQTDATQSNNISINSASAWGAFQSASSYSASLQTSILIVSESAWGAFQSASTYSASLQTSILIVSESTWGVFQSASSYSSSLATSISESNAARIELSASIATTDTNQQLQINSLITNYVSASVVTGLSTSVDSRLDVIETTYATTGSNQFTADQSITGSLYVTGDVVAYSTSDERLKDNIQLISNPIQKVNELRGVEFDWKDGMPKAGHHDYGVIAQDVIKVMPELVNQRHDGYFAVDYDKIIGLLIEVVKDQEKRIKDLENKIGS